MTAPAAKPIYELNRPHLNLLGTREPDLFGRGALVNEGGVMFRQSKNVGELVNWLHAAKEARPAVVLNAGAYTHTIIETHLSNPAAREEFRHVSSTALSAKGVIAGAALAQEGQKA